MPSDTSAKRVVYLEDLEAKSLTSPATKENVSVTVTEQTTDSATVVENNVSITVSEKKTATGATKRQQLSIADMFTKKSSSSSSSSSSSRSGPVQKRARTDTPSLNSIPFSLKEYQDSLSDEEKTLLTLECETLGKSWLKLLKEEIKKPYFLSLKRFLASEGVKGLTDSAPNLKVYPAPKNIYSWSNMTPLGRVKVVIIGQDPYHGPGQAHGAHGEAEAAMLNECSVTVPRDPVDGLRNALSLAWNPSRKRAMRVVHHLLTHAVEGLCFSVPQGVAIPPSLRNIYAEIKTEYPSFEPPKHGNLTAWAENGVLLLNTALTVRAHEAASHSKRGWDEFTAKVVDVVDRYGGANLGDKGSSDAGRGRGIVFLAWGAHAAKVVAKLDKKKHLILTSAHPSPLSANRGFLGNGHFKKANDWLEEKYGPDGCVDWTKL